MGGKLGADPAAEAEAARRVEQVVAAVIAEAERHAAMKKVRVSFLPGGAEHAALIGREQLARRKSTSISSAR